MWRAPLILAVGCCCCCLAPAPVAARAAEGDGSSIEDLRATAALDRIRRQAAQYEANQLVKQARAAERGGRDDEAERLYARALERDPANEAARQGRSAVRDRLGINPEPRNALADIALKNRVRAERAQYEVERAVNAARRAIAGRDFGQARWQLDVAQSFRDEDPAVFDRDELARLDALISAARLRLQGTVEDDRQRELDERNRRTRERHRILRQKSDIEVRNDVREPPAARTQLAAQRAVRERHGREFTATLNSAEEARTPYAALLLYSPEWPAIAARRGAGR